MRLALSVLLSAPASGAWAASYDIQTPMTASDLSYFYGGLTINSNTASILSITNRVYVNSGLIGLGASPSGARLDVKSSGSGKIQTWRDSGGAEVAYMNDSGHLINDYCKSFDKLVTGTVMMFDLASCPSGWSELTAARGRYMVGLPSGGTLAGTQGTALSNLENRPVGQHTHSITDLTHTHTGAYQVGSSWANTGLIALDSFWTITSGNTNLAYTGITQTNNTGATAGTNAPYIQLLICQKN